MKMDLRFWIIGLLNIVGCYGAIVQLTVELDYSTCAGFKASNNALQLIEVVREILKDQEGVDTLATCYIDCVQEPNPVCEAKHTAFNLMFKVNTPVKALLKPGHITRNPHGFTCARVEPVAVDTCVQYGTAKPAIGPKVWMPTNFSRSSVSTSSESSMSSRQVQQPEPENSSKTPLIAGLAGGLAAAAGLLAGAGLLYRKLRKNNSVYNESDTTGILGTPVIPFGEAPNSVAPAGTS